MLYFSNFKFKPSKKWLLAAAIVTFCFVLICGTTAHFLFSNANGKSGPETLQQIQEQKIDNGFRQLRLANNSIEAEAIEAQLVLDLSEAKLASSNLLNENAQKLANEGDYKGALLLYQSIQKREPSFVGAQVDGAYMAFELGDKEMALSMLRRAVKIEPRHFAAWFGIGTILDEKGNLKDAEIAYKNALYYNPNLDAAKRALFAIETKTKGISL